MCIGVFISVFIASILFKIIYKPVELRKYNVDWTEELGVIHTDFSYGNKPANKFDLYLPADNTKKVYGLVVYLHAGGFTTGDKSDDKKILQWLCSKGYVAAGINYTLRNDQNPNASVYSQSLEIKESIPIVVKEAERLGYSLNAMAISGGSAGGTLAMLYAYRDAGESPIPVKMLFEAVGPPSFYPEDWDIYGLDSNPLAAAGLFSVMSGANISVDMLGTESYEEAIKPISAFKWITPNSVPTVCAYGKYDKICPYKSVRHLTKALKKHNVPHEYVEFPNSGHGLQNDDEQYIQYMQQVEKYLATYMTIK
ncbi:alpha/beta hydrolase [Mesoflavibacter zeaxanthinifaciens]|uniref:alpha/beta hydrolase n=1 Tax=Mesoflavibacter zeaxanthinifaciens TaxID=393060 RepID=UPI003A8CEED3